MSQQLLQCVQAIQSGSAPHDAVAILHRCKEVLTLLCAGGSRLDLEDSKGITTLTLLDKAGAVASKALLKGGPWVDALRDISTIHTTMTQACSGYAGLAGVGSPSSTPEAAKTDTGTFVSVSQSLWWLFMRDCVFSADVMPIGVLGVGF